jgi:hypothetical protein
MVKGLLLFDEWHVNAVEDVANFAAKMLSFVSRSPRILAG